MTGFTNGGTGIRGLAHGRSVPPPYSVAVLQRRDHPREWAEGNRFGVFISDPSDSRARQLVACRVTFVDACEHARELAKSDEQRIRARDRANLRRTKHAATNGALTPPGFTVNRNRWESEGAWRAYHHGRPVRDFTGKGARAKAIAFCWETYRASAGVAAPADLDTVDDEVTALLRAAREEARSRCG